MNATQINGIRSVRLRGKTQLCDVLFDAEGRIAKVGPKLSFPRGANVLDGGGGLALPGLIDPHLHLDLAYTLDLVKPNRSGTLIEAIRHWTVAKRTMKPADVRERAIRAIRAEAGFGTAHIRTHVDVASAAGLRLAQGVLEAREATRDLVDIQIVCFPQDGILRDAGAQEQMREAMRMGCDVIGGIAHNENSEDDSKRHIEILFDLAEEFDADIDCHIDETDDPYSRCTEYLAAQTIERRWHGRVTASHVCALSSYDAAHARKVIDLIREARICVVTNPPVNMHLQGRYDRYPKRRGLTRVSELLDAGVPVAAGQDCIRDPFYPFGTGQMLDVAHMLAHADHMTTPQRLEQALDAITFNAARAMRLKDYGAGTGNAADVVVLPVDNVLDAIRLRPLPTFVIKRGRAIVAGSPPAVTAAAGAARRQTRRAAAVSRH